MPKIWYFLRMGNKRQRAYAPSVKKHAHAPKHYEVPQLDKAILSQKWPPHKVGGVMKPRLDLQMLDDNAWQRAAIEQAHQLFFRDFHRVADNDEEAIAHHRRLAG